MERGDGAVRLAVVHASDAEVRSAIVADAVDRAMGAGAWAQIERDVPADGASGGLEGSGLADGGARGVRSPYQALFAEGYVGRPRNDEHPTGRPTGERRVTELARRRATRVLKAMHEDLFKELMRMEAEWLEKNWDFEAGQPMIGQMSSPKERC